MMWPFRRRTPRLIPSMPYPWMDQTELAEWLVRYYNARGMNLQVDDTVVLTIAVTDTSKGFFKRVNNGSAREFAGRIEQALAMIDMTRAYPDAETRLRNIRGILLGDGAWQDPPEKLHAPTPFQ